MVANCQSGKENGIWTHNGDVHKIYLIRCRRPIDSGQRSGKKNRSINGKAQVAVSQRMAISKVKTHHLLINRVTGLDDAMLLHQSHDDLSRYHPAKLSGVEDIIGEPKLSAAARRASACT